MDERWTRLQELFAEGRAVPVDERDAWLERAAPDDDLRAELRELLAEASDGDGFLRPPSLAAAPHAGAPIGPGTTLGDFTLVEELGAGGMGTVYLAQQRQPARRVALKVVSAARAGRSARARFALEAEILGRLEHPGVAAIHGAGVEGGEKDGDGVPWFAMELVDDARSLLAFADERRLDVRARVELARAVCDAVHHAHQRGVIHRDLKPGNILVGANGQPKVIDFGVALVTEEGDPALTETGRVVGTLAAMSPEQVSGRRQDVDVRTDVYALGLVFYELLTGAQALPVADLGLVEAAKRVAEEPPTPPRRHRPDLSADLEAILLHCLQKSPAGRYPSVAALDADLRRWLDDEAIEARPPSATTQLRLFARRHRVAVTAAALIAVVLVAATIVSLQYAWDADAARAEALVARDAADEARVDAVEARDAADASRVEAIEALDVADAARADAVAARDLADAEAARSTALFDELFAFAATTITDTQRRLRDLAGSSEVRRDLLVDVQAQLERLEAFSPGDPDVRRALGRTLLSRARVEGGLESISMGEGAASRELLDRAVEILHGEQVRDADDERFLREVVRALLVRITSHQSRRDVEAGLADVERAQALVALLGPDERPYPPEWLDSNDFWRAALAAARGDVLGQAGDGDAAIDGRNVMAEHLEARIADGVGSSADRDNLATSCFKLALDLSHHRQQHDEAMALLDRADERSREIADDPDFDQATRISLAINDIARADVQRTAGNFEQAIDHGNRSLATLAQLVEEDPNNAFVRARLGGAAFEVGRSLQELERWAEAEQYYGVAESTLATLPGMDSFDAMRADIAARRVVCAERLADDGS